MKRTKKAPRKLTPTGVLRKLRKQLRHEREERALAIESSREHSRAVDRMRATLNGIGDREAQLCHLANRIRNALKGKPPEITREIVGILQTVGL